MNLLLALTLLATAPANAVERLGWLAGNWQEVKGERWTEEVWMPPRGGRMIGVGRSGKGAAKGSFEFIRIEADADGTPVFWGAPSAGLATPFRLVSATATSAVFENAGHDYPQRISYRAEGGVLHAVTSKIDGSSVQRWAYRRAKTG